MESLTVEEIVSSYDLSPHPEGGYYKETFRDPQNVSFVDASCDSPAGVFSASTAILFVLPKREVQLPPSPSTGLFRSMAFHRWCSFMCRTTDFEWNAH